MNISDIRIKLLDTESKILALAAITIDECFVVHDIKVIQGSESPFIAMPGRKTSSGKYKDIAHPLDTPTREMIANAVLAAYERAKSEAAAGN